jgi:hypothetical protein
MENKKINLEKKILIAEGIFVAGIFVYLFFSMSPAAVSPIAGKVVSDPDFVFEIKNGDQVMVSVDQQFTNPILLKEGADVTLPPGTYYWKVKNWLKESPVYSFTIESNVGINLRQGQDQNRLENAGNVGVDVTKDKGGITSNIPLDPGKSTTVPKDGSSYQGKQNA